MVIRRRTGWTAQFAPRTLAAVLMMLALAAAGCTSPGLRAGDAATVADSSMAQISVDGGEWATADGGAVVPEGARVRAAGDDATLVFRGGAVRLGPGATTVVDSDSVEVVSGEVLVDGSGPLVVVGDATVTGGGGVFRVSSGLSARVGVYAGTATVTRPAQEREVPALRQLDLTGLRLAAVPDPLRYREGDTWDQELLAEAIAFDGEAARLANGIDISIGRDPLRPRFYAQLAGDAVVQYLPTAATVVRRGAFGPPSDVLLTIFVSRAAPDPVGEALRLVAGLRDAGARWGLIARELGVASDAVVAAVDDLGAEEQLAVAARNAALDEPAGRPRPARGGDETDPAPAADVTAQPDAPRTTSGTSDDPDPVQRTTPRDSDGGGGGDAAGGDGGDGDAGGGDGGGGDATVTEVVDDVVKRVSDPASGGDDPGETSPVGGVDLPLPDLPHND